MIPGDQVLAGLIIVAVLGYMAGWVHGQLDGKDRDTRLLDRMENESWTLRAKSTEDDDVYYEVIEHWMAAPHERLVARGDSPRAALHAAITDPSA